MNTIYTREPRGSWIHAIPAILLFAISVLISGPAFAHALGSSTALQFSDANPTDGDVVTITGTHTYTGTAGPGPCNGVGCPHFIPAVGTAVVGTTMHIQARYDSAEADPVLRYLACGEPGVTVAWENVGSGVTNASGQFSTNFDTTGLGDQTICFRAQSMPGGGSHTTGENKSGELGLDIDVADCPVTGVVLTNPQVTGGTYVNGAAKGPWTLDMEITNCLGEAVDFKVQGGANAWAPYNSPTTVSDGTYIEIFKKKNTVITWNVTLDHNQSETISFTVGTTSSVVACGDNTEFLSGAWSAAYIDPLTWLPAKTPYTNRATVSSLPCP